MLYVALAEACALAIVATGFAGLLRSQQRQHDRRTDLLLNQLLHATGRTWTPPPDLVKFMNDVMMTSLVIICSTESLFQGPPPVYIGFGSITIENPAALSKLVIGEREQREEIRSFLGRIRFVFRQRRPLAETGLTAVGEDARKWLEAARVFL